VATVQTHILIYKDTQHYIPADSHLLQDCKSTVCTYQQAPDFDDTSSFFWYVTDNVCVYMNPVYDPLDTKMYIL